MCSSARVSPAASRSAAMWPVTLASGALAGVIPTTGTRPVSRSRSTCRLYPSNSIERDLRPCRIWLSSTLIRRSLATPRRSAGAGPARSTSWSRTWRAAAPPRLRPHRRPGGDERLHPAQQAQHPGQGLVPGGRVVPVPVQRRFQAGGGQLRRPSLLRHHRDSCGLPPPLQHRDHAQGLAQGVSHQVDRVLHPSRAPQGTGVQRRAQRGRPEPLRPRGQVNRALDQPPVQVMLDQPLAESHQGALGKRRFLRARAAQDQLPAPVHHRRLDHLVVTDPRIGLQDRCQRQLRRRNRRLALRAVHVGPCQLRLEYLVKQLMAILAQEHKQLRPPHQPDHRLLRRTAQPAASTQQDARPISLARSWSLTIRYEQGIAHSTTVNRSHDETRTHYLTGALVVLC